MPARDLREIAALRTHRQLLASRYQTDNVSFSSGRIGFVLVGLGVLSFAGSGLLLALGVDRLAFIGVIILASALLCLTGWFLWWIGTTERNEHAKTRSRVKELELELPPFFERITQHLGASLVVDDGLKPTISFLERTGMFAVPNLLLARLFHAGNRRYRIEGSVEGAPCAIVVVLGEPGSGTSRPHTAMSRSALGPHLFVLLPGTTAEAAPLDGFQLVHERSDLVAIRALGTLPDTETLFRWIKSLGARKAEQAAASAEAPMYPSAEEAIGALLHALASDTPEDAIAAIDPQLFWKRESVPTAAAVRVWAQDYALAGIGPFSLEPWSPGKFASECRVRLGEGDKQRLLTIQAFQEPGGSFRVSYLGEGERHCGWHDTSRDSISD